MQEFKNHTFAVCAYKESKYLEECICSLEKQNVKSNIIICTSTPNEYIDSIAKKHGLNVYVNNGESGIGEDWNFAVSQTNTTYVTVAHQDDIYNENYLEEIVKFINKKKDFVIAFTDYRELKNGEIIPLTKNLKIKKKLLIPVKLFPKSKLCKRLSLSFGSPICCPSVTLNTEKLGKTPYKMEFKCDLDWDSWLEFSKYKGYFAYIPKELMQHRIHEESETSNLIENNVRLEEDYEIFKRLWPNWIAKILMSKYKEAIKTNSIK